MGSHGMIMEVGVRLLMAYLNFEVPECVDGEKSTKMAEVAKFIGMYT
jgi:hypothetical protein